MLELREFIKEYLNSDEGVVIREAFLNAPEPEANDQNETNDGSSSEKITKNFTDLEKRIEEILDEYIKPAVESDGGAIELDSFDNGVVKVILKGSCSGCPSSTMTLKHGIESMLKNMLPEVTEVEAING